MRLLALDLARKTGWAVGSPDGIEGFGTHELPKTDKWNLGEYGMAARMFCRRILQHTEPEWVVYEAPILRSGKIKTRGNGKQFVATVDTPEKLRKIYGLPWELEIECERADIPVREANINAVRAAFLMGKVPQKSEECKTAVKVMARRRGWEVLDDNEADALAVLDYELAIKHPREMAVRKINAGRSAILSSSGPDVFAGSRAFFPPAIPPAANNPSSSAGASNASSTASGTLYGMPVTIHRSPGSDMPLTLLGQPPAPRFKR